MPVLNQMTYYLWIPMSRWFLASGSCSEKQINEATGISKPCRQLNVLGLQSQWSAMVSRKMGSGFWSLDFQL